MYIIGIDPGGCGALVVTDSNLNVLKVQKYNDGSEYIDILKNYPVDDTIVVIERVHSMPRDGKKQAFTFGWYRGQIEGICKSLGFNYICDSITDPVVWKSSVGVNSDKSSSIDKTKFINKNVLNYAVSNVISKGKNKGKIIYDDNIVEAFLLCYYYINYINKNKKEN